MSQLLLGLGNNYNLTWSQPICPGGISNVSRSLKPRVIQCFEAHCVKQIARSSIYPQIRSLIFAIGFYLWSISMYNHRATSGCLLSVPRFNANLRTFQCGGEFDWPYCSNTEMTRQASIIVRKTYCLTD